MSNRNTYKYNVKLGNRILHTGITNNLKRREYEHQQKYGDKVHIERVGNIVTRKSAYKWEAEQRAKGKPN